MLIIRPMTLDDADAKGYVHYASWKETYAGLMDQNYLDNLDLGKRQTLARQHPENTLVAELDGKIVGFSCYVPCRDPDLLGCGEVQAIYLLREAQGLGIGRKLMDAAIGMLAEYQTVTVWVLKGNDKAIGFYQHYGFRFDGAEKVFPLGTELRMVFTRS